jgi:beta-N-acetylhexosaminidase
MGCAALGRAGTQSTHEAELLPRNQSARCAPTSAACALARYNDSMSVRDVRQHAGQMAIAGFAGHSVPPDLRKLAREFDLGGIILFARNVESPEQVAEVAREAGTLTKELPLWVSVDQEGGRVARLRAPFTVWPPMLTLGRSGDEQLAARFAKALASELRAVGITLDYAPVLDIRTNPKNPVIGDRALAEKPEDVARLARVIIDTLQAEGIAACGKHFPGHGDTSTDSHFELPLIEHPPDRLEAVEFVPFKTAIESRVASLMTAHILVPAIDDQNPATLSPAIVDGLLKKKLGFDGVVMTDDIEMKAISARYTTAEATMRALRAGCDVVLMCGAGQEAQFEALETVVHALEDGTLPLKRAEDALSRHRRMKERFLAPPRPAPLDRRALLTLLGREEHQAVAAEMARFA